MDKGGTELLLARAYLENGKTDLALSFIDISIDSMRQTYGRDGELLFSAIIVDSYLKAGRTKQAVSLANKYIQKIKEYKVETYCVLSELMRVRAEAQITSFRSGDTGIYDLQSIEQDIREAYENARSLGNVTIQIRCCNTLAWLAQVSDNPALLEEARALVTEAISRVKFGENELKTTPDIETALSLLKNL